MELVSKTTFYGRINIQIDYARDLTILLCNGELEFTEIISHMKRLYQGNDPPPTKKILWDIRNASISALTVDQVYHIASKFNFVMDGGKTAVVALQDINYDIVKIFEEEAIDIPRDFIVFREMEEATSWLDK